MHIMIQKCTFKVNCPYNAANLQCVVIICKDSFLDNPALA